MFSTRMNIEDFDPALWAAMRAETRRQEDHIELIASENYASPRVLQAQGSALTNKYAEGYPGKRYYGGCEHVDEVERLAIERACALFGADWANVQPHSGSQANAAVYQALLTPGDTVAGMSLAHGGHLTHGAKVNFSGKLYQAVQYGVNTEGLIDYDALFRLAQEHRPRMLVAGFPPIRATWISPAARDRRQRRRLAVRRHRARGRPGRGRAVSQSGALRGHRHHHHAQDAPGSARRSHHGPRQSGYRKEDRLDGVPRHPGRPADARDRGQGGGVQEAQQADFAGYQRQVLANARAMAATFQDRGYKIVSGGTDNHLLLVDLTGKS